MISLSWSQVSAWRLSQHYLLQPADRGQLLNVVSHICGLHAQLMSAAELAVWARVQDLSTTEVQEALWRDRTLVKTWAMRGTLHLLHASELPAYCAALSHSVSAFYRRPSWLKYHEVTLSELEAVIEGVRTTLSDSPLTREQLAEAIVEQTGQPKLAELLRSGWGALLKPAAHGGYLCFGPNQGQNVTFVRPDQWLGDGHSVDPAGALNEILRRYLTAYGPATPDDFGRWWGIDPSKAKKLFKALADEIEAVEVEGWSAWALSSTLKQIEAGPAPDSVRLLPYFDPYVVGLPRNCHYFLPEAHKGRVYRPQGWISPVVLVNGRIEGVWEYDQQRSQLVVKADMFAPPTPEVKQGIEIEANRLGHFLEAEVELIFP